MSQTVRDSLWAAAVLPAHFIDTFCDSSSFDGDFTRNWLRGFTPCFADVAVLGESPSPLPSRCTIHILGPMLSPVPGFVTLAAVFRSPVQFSPPDAYPREHPSFHRHGATTEPPSAARIAPLTLPPSHLTPSCVVPPRLGAPGRHRGALRPAGVRPLGAHRPLQVAGLVLEAAPGPGSQHRGVPTHRAVPAERAAGHVLRVAHPLQAEPRGRALRVGRCVSGAAAARGGPTALLEGFTWGLKTQNPKNI